MEFVLDISKWVCGHPTESRGRVGKGRSALLNEEGYQCCVGQFSEQLGIEKEAMLGLTTVGALYCRAKAESTSKVLEEYLSKLRILQPNLIISPLLGGLYSANDNSSIHTIGERVDRLKGVLWSAGHTLKVLHEELIPVCTPTS